MKKNLRLHRLNGWAVMEWSGAISVILEKTVLMGLTGQKAQVASNGKRRLGKDRTVAYHDH